MHKLREMRGGSGAEPADSRILPHDLDAEGAVLSAVMVDASALGKVQGILVPEHFYSEAHRRIYEASVDLSAKGQPIDVVQVATRLREHDRLAQVGGMEYLTEVLNSAPTVANVARYAATIRDAWRVRQLMLLCQRIVAQGYAGYGDPQSFIASSAQAVGGLARESSEPGIVAATRTLAMRDALARLVAIFGIQHGLPQASLIAVLRDVVEWMAFEGKHAPARPLENGYASPL